MSVCRACDVCDGNHHWLAAWDGGPDYECKHCDARTWCCTQCDEEVSSPDTECAACCEDGEDDGPITATKGGETEGRRDEMSTEVHPDLCEYTAVCTVGPSGSCGRGAGHPGFVGCLCPCHSDGIAHPKPDNWKPSPLHLKAIEALNVLADAHDLEACDPDGECYFPRCLADGCEAASRKESE